MTTPTLRLVDDISGSYAVHLDGEHIGYVLRLSVRLWESYTASMIQIRGRTHRDGRHRTRRDAVAEVVTAHQRRNGRRKR